MTLGKPDAGKPLVRFDEGRSETVIGLVPLQPVRSAYSTVEGVDTNLTGRPFLVWFRQRHDPGDRVTLKVLRPDGQQKEVSYELTPRDN
jgi:hypothetical protein